MSIISTSRLFVTVLLVTTCIAFTGCKDEKPSTPPIPLNTNLHIQFSPKLSYSTTTDVDGNIYATIKIGTQTWMAENLRVTHYRNGDTIPELKSDSAWSKAMAGAQCGYKGASLASKSHNDSVTLFKYGRLYNGYVLKDKRGITPLGYKLPDDEDFKVLSNYVSTHMGQSSSIAKALSGTTDWKINIDNGLLDLSKNNSLGMTALPSGMRFGDGTYDGLGISVYWWTLSESTSTSNWSRAMFYDQSDIVKLIQDLRSGLSIRCVSIF
jgi:uncharacterized protein (TIGR02145 family)